MPKDAYFFSHDSNAFDDPKILQIRTECGGLEAYGMFWVLIEMLRNQSDYKLPRSDRSLNAIAMRMQCDRTQLSALLNVSFEIGLLTCSDDHFWSDSLLRRMTSYDERSQKARESAKKRWKNANAMPTHSEGSAVQYSTVQYSTVQKSTVQNGIEEGSGGSVPKGTTHTKKASPFSPPNLEEVTQYFLSRNLPILEAEKFFNHFESNGWKVGGKAPMKSWTAAARNWGLNIELFQPKNQNGNGATNFNNSPKRRAGEGVPIDSGYLERRAALARGE